MVVSTAKLEANRRNSQKSTGPRTEDGKKRSSLNAVTHGVTARTVLLPGEDAAALAARQQHLIDSFQPRSLVELALVEGMAGDIWRSDRAERADEAIEHLVFQRSAGSSAKAAQAVSEPGIIEVDVETCILVHSSSFLVVCSMMSRSWWRPR